VKPILAAFAFGDIHQAGTQAARCFASMSSRSRAIRTTQASSLGLRRPQRVIRQIAPSSRGVPLPIRASLSLAGRRRSSLLHLPSSDGAHGVLPRPSQVYSLSRVDTPRLLRRDELSRSHRCARVASTFLPVRAHVPFMPPLPPRLIFVGVTDRLLELTRSAKTIGRGCGGVDFWALTPVCGPLP
jgi:hypothetical protein